MISIIVPIYNVEKYLDKCITSIANQTYKEIEILLINDGSTDNSGFICEQYAKQDARIKVIHQENQGVVSARKKGLAIAGGEYIGFVDSDDYIEPNMYENLYTKILESDADFVHSGYYKNDKKYVYGVQEEKIYEIQDVEEYLIHNVFDDTNRYSMPPSNWSKLYKRELIQKAYNDVPEHIAYGEDLICLCSCIINSKKIAYMNRAFYHYMSRQDSVSNTARVENIKRENDLYDSLNELIFKYSLDKKVNGCVKRFYLRNTAIWLKKITGIPIATYQYPDMSDLINKKIVIYGAGEVGRDYYLQMSRYHRCNIIAMVDSNSNLCTYEYITISSPDELSKMSFDIIVIAVMKEETAAEIKKGLQLRGIEKEKIIWKQPELCI